MKKSELDSVIEEVVYEVLAEQTSLRTSKEEILGKFPTLRRTLINLLTADFDQFIDDIKWIAPKPTTFEVVFSNDQSFYLKWTGKGFEAQVQGKKYFLTSTEDFQQALDKLNDLLKYSKPTSGEGDEIGNEDEGGEFDEPLEEPGEEEPEEEL